MNKGVAIILIIVGIIMTGLLVSGLIEQHELEQDIKNDAQENPELCTNPYLPEENKKMIGCP